MNRKIYINVFVNNIARYQEFFQNLGFDFDYERSDETKVYLSLSCSTYIIFIEDKLAINNQNNNLVIGMFANSKQEVLDTCNLAFKHDAYQVSEPFENEKLFKWAFKDFDNNMWEIIYEK
jgi:predicted lactoylglutathione lyase